MVWVLNIVGRVLLSSDVLTCYCGIYHKAGKGTVFKFHLRGVTICIGLSLE